MSSAIPIQVSRSWRRWIILIFGYSCAASRLKQLPPVFVVQLCSATVLLTPVSTTSRYCGTNDSQPRGDQRNAQSCLTALFLPGIVVQCNFCGNDHGLHDGSASTCNAPIYVAQSLPPTTEALMRGIELRRLPSSRVRTPPPMDSNICKLR